MIDLLRIEIELRSHRGTFQEKKTWIQFFAIQEQTSQTLRDLKMHTHVSKTAYNASKIGLLAGSL